MLWNRPFFKHGYVKIYSRRRETGGRRVVAAAAALG
jgi:hypothetical protein